MAAILKILNGGYHKNQVICPDIMICYIAGHQYTKFHANIYVQTKVIAILSFRWRPFWKKWMAPITRIRWYVLKFGMICYTAGHQYTKFHANIHM